MNKTLWHYRHLAFHWHSWPVQFCNSIKIKSQNPLVSQHYFHMPKPCVRITASNLFPPSSAYIVLLQFNEWSSKLHAAAYYCGLSVLRMDTTIAHQAWNHSLTGLAKKTVNTSLYGRTSCLLDLKRVMLTDQSLYKRILKALWNATQMCSMLSMWLAHIKAKINLNMRDSFSGKLARRR